MRNVRTLSDYLMVVEEILATRCGFAIKLKTLDSENRCRNPGCKFRWLPCQREHLMKRRSRL